MSQSVETNVSELVQKSQNEDSEAQNQLAKLGLEFAKEGLECLNLTDLQLIEEACAYAVVLAWDELSIFGENQPYREWIRRVAQSYALRVSREKAQLPDVPILSDLVLPEPLLRFRNEVHSARSLEARLDDCIEQLPSDQAKAIQLVYLEGLSSQDASQRLHMSRYDFTTMLHCAEARLKEIIES